MPDGKIDENKNTRSVHNTLGRIIINDPNATVQIYGEYTFVNTATGERFYKVKGFSFGRQAVTAQEEFLKMRNESIHSAKIRLADEFKASKWLDNDSKADYDERAKIREKRTGLLRERNYDEYQEIDYSRKSLDRKIELYKVLQYVEITKEKFLIISV
jgi:hypothetical protein